MTDDSRLSRLLQPKGQCNRIWCAQACRPLITSFATAAKSFTNNGGRNNSSSPFCWRSTCTAPDKEGGRHPKHSAAIPIAIVFYNNIVSTTEINHTLRKELKRITGSSWREEKPLLPTSPMTPTHTRPTVTVTETLIQ